MVSQGKAVPLRQKVYNLLEDGSDKFWPQTLRLILISLVVFSTITTVSASVPEIFQRWGWLLRIFDLSVGALFTVEFSLRLWVAPDHPPWRRLSPFMARRQWIRTWSAKLDFIAIIPFYLSVFDNISLHSFIVLRLFRFFKLARYSAGLASLGDAIRQERRALFGCLVILAGMVLISSSLMYSVEGVVQPEKFGTIPRAMYWAVITLTTVGYGDVTPITGGGRLIASLTAIGGLVMLAMPAGIIASAFSLQVHRRDFIVSWGMISSVPLFANLDVTELSAIMNRMRSRTYEPGEDVVHRHDPIEYMYFVVSGRLDAAFAPNSQYTEGDYFGEAGVLNKTKWPSRIRAVTRCKLMMLKAEDLEQLMESLPDMAEEIRTVAKERTDAMGKSAAAPEK